MRIYLCKECHQELVKPMSVYPADFYHGKTGRFCNDLCRRQYNKKSLEQKRADHYAWVREEVRVNQLDLF